MNSRKKQILLSLIKADTIYKASAVWCKLLSPFLMEPFLLSGVWLVECFLK